MAIEGKNNIIEMARTHRAPFWRIYESEVKRASGNYVASADFGIENLGYEISLEDLRKKLDMLTPGRYLFVAYKDNSAKKGGIDSWIEIESRHGSVAAIGSTGAESPALYVEGIGAVTSENFEQVIETKIKKLQEEQQQKIDLDNLKRENADLKKQVAENETGFKKGLMTVGGFAYNMMADTPKGKEFIGMVRKAMFGMNQLASDRPAGAQSETISGTGDGNVDDARMIGALERLAKNNPDILGQLEKLADLKENDPATFEQAVTML